MNVYVIVAEHPTEPAETVEVFATMAQAQARASELAELFAGQLPREDYEAALAGGTWQKVLELLEEHFGAQYVRIDIMNLEVQS